MSPHRAVSLPAVTFAEAAEAILREERRAMTANEITEIALARRLIRSGGKTPVATMTAALYRLPAESSIAPRVRRWRAASETGLSALELRRQTSSGT